MSKLHPIHAYHMDQSWSLTPTASWQLVKEIVAGAGRDQQNLSGRLLSRPLSTSGGDQHSIGQGRRIQPTERFNSAKGDRSQTGKEITHQIQMRAGNIDGLRAIAMTAVVACHAGIFAIGWMGVWLFFVISGYVVTTSVLARPGSFGQFGIRRLRRIAPIYWAYILIGLIVVGGTADWRAVLGLLTFTNNLAGMFGGHYLCCGGWPTGRVDDLGRNAVLRGLWRTAFLGATTGYHPHAVGHVGRGPALPLRVRSYGAGTRRLAWLADPRRAADPG